MNAAGCNALSQHGDREPRKARSDLVEKLGFGPEPVPVPALGVNVAAADGSQQFADPLGFVSLRHCVRARLETESIPLLTGSRTMRRRCRMPPVGTSSCSRPLIVTFDAPGRRDAFTSSDVSPARKSCRSPAGPRHALHAEGERSSSLFRTRSSAISPAILPLSTSARRRASEAIEILDGGSSGIHTAVAACNARRASRPPHRRRRFLGLGKDRSDRGNEGFAPYG